MNFHRAHLACNQELHTNHDYFGYIECLFRTLRSKQTKSPKMIGRNKRRFEPVFSIGTFSRYLFFVSDFENNLDIDVLHQNGQIVLNYLLVLVL